MARLEPKHKAFAVARLAIFESPTEVAQCMNRRFGLDVSPQHVECFDPEKANGKRLSRKWRDAFYRAREKYLAAASNAAIAEKLGTMAVDRVAEHLELDRIGL